MSETVAIILPLFFMVLYFILSDNDDKTHNPTMNSFSNLKAYTDGFSKGIKE
jgi:hypothetical protein